MNRLEECIKVVRACKSDIQKELVHSKDLDLEVVEELKRRVVYLEDTTLLLTQLGVFGQFVDMILKVSR